MQKSNTKIQPTNLIKPNLKQHYKKQNHNAIHNQDIITKQTRQPTHQTKNKIKTSSNKPNKTNKTKLNSQSKTPKYTNKLKTKRNYKPETAKR